MAIRLRMVEGKTAALCAAHSDPEPGDVYLHDGWHEALSAKFARDWGLAFTSAEKDRLMDSQERPHRAGEGPAEE